MPALKFRPKSISFWLPLLTAGVVFLVVSLSSLWVLGIYRGQADSAVRARLVTAVNLAALQIDGDLHATLKTVRQESSPEFQQISASLQRIMQADPEIVVLRTFRIVQNRALVIVDGEKSAEFTRHMLDSLPEITSTSLDQIHDMTSGFVDLLPVATAQGNLLVAYAPVHTTTGVDDAVLMMGIAQPAAGPQTMLGAVLISALLLVFVSAGAAYWLGRQLADVLSALAADSATQNLDLHSPGSERIRRLQNHSVLEVGKLAQAVADRLPPELQKMLAAEQAQSAAMAEQAEMMMNSMTFIHKASAVAAAASSELDPETLPGLVVDLLITQFEVDYAGFYSTHSSGGWLELRAARGFNKTTPVDRIQFGESLVGQAAEERQMRVENSEPGVVARTALAVPMLIDRRILGVILLQSEQPAYFQGQIASIFQAMAEQVAVAFRNALLFAEEKAEFKSLQQSYQQVTQSAWERFLEERGLVGYQASALGVEKATTFQSSPDTLRLALNVRGKLVGYLEATRPSGTQDWNQEEKDLLETLTRQLSVALDNARLYSATQRSAEREKMLSEITTQVRSSTSVDAIMQTAVQELAGALNISRGIIRLRPASPAAPRPAGVDGNPEEGGK